MSRAIVGGLIGNGFEAGAISIAEPNPEQRQQLKSDFAGAAISEKNATVTATSNVVVLAVKPQVVATVCKEIHAAVSSNQALVLSIAAGVRCNDIERWLGGMAAVVRVMPNQPALIRRGVSGLFANSRTTPEQAALAERIIGSVGSVVRVERESDIDTVTAISGSGPAYFYLLIDLLQKSAQDFGLDAQQSRELAIATATGAAELASVSTESSDQLIARVRSPGGTTAAALDSLAADGIRDIVARALQAARERAIELADDAHRNNQD